MTWCTSAEHLRRCYCAFADMAYDDSRLNRRIPMTHPTHNAQPQLAQARGNHHRTQCRSPPPACFTNSRHTHHASKVDKNVVTRPDNLCPLGQLIRHAVHSQTQSQPKHHTGLEHQHTQKQQFCTSSMSACMYVCMCASCPSATASDQPHTPLQRQTQPQYPCNQQIRTPTGSNSLLPSGATAVGQLAMQSLKGFWQC